MAHRLLRARVRHRAAGRLTSAGVAIALGLAWSFYEFLVLPVISLQEDLMSLPELPRLLMFALWLLLTAAASVGLVALLARRAGGGSVMMVSAACVLLALVLTNWAVYLVFRTFCR